MSSLMEKEQITFDGLGIAPAGLDYLDKVNFRHPTPIQGKAIPIGIEGKDIVGIAQTGTGKTLAFAIPIINQILKVPGTKALIILPTRELALQVDEVFQKVGRSFGIDSAVVIGG